MLNRHFNEELVMTRRNDEDFENSTKCWICDNAYVDGDVKARDHCHITGKYRGSTHIDCHINVKLNLKILIICHNLSNYDSHLIMQERGKFKKQIRKYMSFIISNKLIFIDSFHLLSSLLDSFVRNLSKDDFRYCSQEFDTNVLDLVQQEEFYTYHFMSGFDKFKEKFPRKVFIVSWAVKRLVIKNMNMLLRFGIHFKYIRLSRIVIEMYCFSVGWCFWKILK